MKIIYLDSAISDKERAEILFKGDLLIYKNIEAMKKLIEYSDELLKQALGDLKPVLAQHYLDPECFLEKTGTVQTDFRQNDYPKVLFFAVLEQCGVNLQQTFYDHFPMRIVPFNQIYAGAHRAAVGHHRDTWGANLYSQINWWAPLYELEAERTIALYPKYWNEPIANNTANWSFEEYLSARKVALPERKSAYPSAPSPIEKVDESGVVKIMLEPGDVLSFSSAHLHASVPNTTQAIRFSVEMRTLNKADLLEGRVAPNVDNAATTPMYQWFKGITDKRPLNDIMANL